MEKKEDEKTFTDEQFADYLSKTFVFALFVACGALLAYIARFAKFGWSDSQEVWGQFGDFLGGVINPVVGLLTAFLVLMSVSIQRKELKASVQEMKAANASTSKMSFEQSLFAWLANYQSLLSDISDRQGGTGRATLNYWYSERFSGEIIALRSPSFTTAFGYGEPSRGLSALIADPRSSHHRPIVEELFAHALSAFGSVVREHRVALEPIFRTLSRLLRWIDKSEGDPEDKWHYIALVNSQLSWIEQVYALYFILYSAPSAFGSVVNKYALLDQVDNQDPLVFLITHELTARPPRNYTDVLPEARVWPFQNTAFESDLARANLGLEQEPN